MAAAMLGSTAVFADSAQVEYKYLTKDKIQVAIGASASSDQATILALKDGVALESVASGDIAYIGQDAADDGIGLEITQPANAIFEFNTAGPADRESSGKIDIYGAGSKNTLGSKLEVYEMAPISKIEFADKTGLTLKDNATQEEIRTALSGKTLTVTHASDAADTSPIAIDGTADKDFTYEIATGTSGSYLKATYTPADGSKFGVVSGDSLASLEADSPAVTVESGVDYTYSLKDDGKLTYGVDETVTADALKTAVAGLITAEPPAGFTVDPDKVELFDEAGTNPVTFENAVLAINGASDGESLSYTVKYDGEATTNKLTIEIKQRTVTSVSLAADKTDVPLPYGTTKEQIVNELKTGKYVKLTAELTYDDTTKQSKDVTAAADYVVSGDGPTAYTVTASYTETVKSNDVTLNVSISDVANSTITGTVKLKSNPRVPDDSPAVKGAAGILVAAYSKDGTALQGVALTDADGAYSVTVPSDGEYQLVISHVDLGVEDGKATQAMNYGGVVRAVTVTGGEATVDGIILTRVAGDADGDGVVDSAADKQEVTTFKGRDYINPTAAN